MQIKFIPMLLLLGCSALALAQTPVACPIGYGVTSQLVNTGQSCSPLTSPTGAYITQTGLTAAMSSVTICDTGTTCLSGFYTLYVYVSISSTGTLLSAVTSNITFTDSSRTYSNVALGAALSLLTTTPGSYSYSFYHAANTAVTVNTSTTTLTGAPVYSFYSRLVLHGTP